MCGGAGAACCGEGGISVYHARCGGGVQAEAGRVQANDAGLQGRQRGRGPPARRGVFRADREQVRSMHRSASMPFIEVYVEVPLDVAESRDPKGLYQKARAGEIRGFTGIDQPYEAPETPELVVHTAACTVEESATTVMAFLGAEGMLKQG